MVDLRLLKFNGVEVQDLSHLVKLVQKSTGRFFRCVFSEHLTVYEATTSQLLNACSKTSHDKTISRRDYPTTTFRFELEDDREIVLLADKTRRASQSILRRYRIQAPQYAL